MTRELIHTAAMTLDVMMLMKVMGQEDEEIISLDEGFV